jgi:hypothetical protein
MAKTENHFAIKYFTVTPTPDIQAPVCPRPERGRHRVRLRTGIHFDCGFHPNTPTLAARRPVHLIVVF